MSTQHTPGPWEVSPEPARTRGEHPCAVWGPHNPICYVSEVSILGRDDAAIDAEIKANADLIAAAPDLLEACRLALTDYADYSNSVTDDLRAAIARAEGRTDG